VGGGVDAALAELLLDEGVPEVFHLVVGASRQLRGNLRPLVAEDGVEVDDEVFLLLGEGAPLQVRPQVVYPPQPAALPTPLEA
jgi:hypothetical protein